MSLFAVMNTNARDEQFDELRKKISDLERRLAEARKQIEDFRAYEDGWGDKFDSFCARIEAEARKQAFDEAAKIVERYQAEAGRQSFGNPIFVSLTEIAKTLRLERDKTP